MVDGIKIINVEGEGCGMCNIVELFKMLLNIFYYWLMFKFNGGLQVVVDVVY